MHRPDVILLDLRMPGLTGTETMQILRADPSFVNTPIVALTAYALDAERRLALDAGFDQLIAKPCLPDALAEAVERILSDRPPASGLLTRLIAVTRQRCNCDGNERLRRTTSFIPHSHDCRGGAI
jgi:DNA-binding response OmpR family regulator